MKTLILSGFGTNCEKETRHACLQAGAEAVEVRHINEIYQSALNLESYGFLILGGGFMDGDDLGSGRACANRFRYRDLPGGGTFLDRLHEFIDQGRLVLGICNGFQVLVKLGLLPGALSPGKKESRVTLTNNAHGRFENRWVHLHADPNSPCVFTKGLGPLELPVRHGEGRLIGEDDALTDRLVEQGLAPLRYALADGSPTEEYPANPNGSPHGIAALCNTQGTVLGLMPHPEAYNHYTNHPRWTRQVAEHGAPTDETGDGLALFRNAYAYLKARG
ncbi:MAG: phosphoribosylformylglycinamidine synthase subunit PurQ [Deltaproteobacteria bacterium]|nr:phosphoribosylformylglycinamidine synthase subunit PurQ [Deltaproteobacteria bacterium]